MLREIICPKGPLASRVRTYVLISIAELDRYVAKTYTHRCQNCNSSWATILTIW